MGVCVSVGLTAPHPDYEPASFGTKCQGHCRFLSAGVAFTFRHATGKSSQKRKGRDLQSLPTLLDVGYSPFFYIAAYLYCHIAVYMYIRIYDYANISLYGLPCRPYSGTVLSVSYHGTACSLLRPLSLGLPLFPVTAEPSGETVS